MLLIFPAKFQKVRNYYNQLDFSNFLKLAEKLITTNNILFVTRLTTTNWFMYHWLRPIPTQGSIRPRDLDRYHFEFVGQAACSSREESSRPRIFQGVHVCNCFASWPNNIEQGRRHHHCPSTADIAGRNRAFMKLLFSVYPSKVFSSLIRKKVDLQIHFFRIRLKNT